MRSPAVLLLGATYLFGLGSAHRFDWIDELPKCWQHCLSNTSDGCESQNCICDASQSSSYLTSAVECAVAKCEADSWGLELAFLGPLQIFCGASGEDIPSSILKSAYECATATATAAPTTSTRRVEHSTQGDHHTKGGNGLKSTISSTLTRTSTDGDGNTLQIVVPIVMGPSTLSTGKIATSTLESKSSSTSASASSSAAASPSQTAAPSSPAPTQAQSAPSSTTTAEATQRTSNANGSLFENPQAGAPNRAVSGMLVGLGVIVGVFMRL